MKRLFLPVLLVCSPLVVLWCFKPVSAQDSRFERRFPNPNVEVDKALQELQSSVRGRLPILEGFVEGTNEPLDHFERGFYECVIKVTSDSGGGTLVHITAKITAWYTSSNPAQSGYRVLSSNGRIETDLLGRLEELLAKKSSGATSAVPPTAALLPPPIVPIVRNPPVPAAVVTPPNEALAAPTNEDLNSLKLRREEDEKKAKALNADVNSLEEILRNQSHPGNLAVVRKPATPVFAKPGGSVLLSADAEDEFEVLGLEGNWVHVQISGVSRGWIQRAQLDLPEGFADSSAKESPVGAANDFGFRVTREETHLFTGSWQELQGKNVQIIWVEPVSQSSRTSGAEAKRNFAKALFAKAYKELASLDQPPAGVVIVFDSADGGQVSAMISILGQWQAGKLSDDSFWKQCSIDPPELFQEIHKP
jgi:hypothetical protein